MEKATPHRKLSVVKKLIEAGKVRMTASAAAGGELKLTVIDDVLIVSFKEL